MLVVADKDMGKAQALARELGQEIWAMRLATHKAHDSIDQAIDYSVAAKAKGPIVLADRGPTTPAPALHRTARSCCGAWSSERCGTWRLVSTGTQWPCRSVRRPALAPPSTCAIGGKTGPASGDPIDLRVTVRALSDDHTPGGLSKGVRGSDPRPM